MSHVEITRASLLAFLLSIAALPAVAGGIQITGTPPKATVGTKYQWVPTTTGGNKAKYEFAYIDLPSWSGTYRSSGAIIGTPTKPGVYSFQVEVWDGANSGVSAPFKITVTGGTPPPPTVPPPTKLTISGTPEATIETGKFYSFRPTVVAPAGAKLTYQIAQKPSWAQFSATTGTLSGTPTKAGVAGNIVVGVNDGTQTANLRAFSITVDAAPASPPGSVTLSWVVPTTNTNGSPLTNLAHYVVRYGTSSSALNSQLSVKTNEVEIGNLAAGVWYFEVAAVNTLNVESQFSTPASKQIK
jgi:hypothetical protein